VSLASRTPIGFQHARYPRNSHFDIIGYLKQQEAQMNREESEDNTIYKVVLNHEEQYSIWPADRENALGWKDAGKSGTKEDCLAYIKEVWTDMRPLSLRKQMEKAAQNS
jgi:MbtH protein